MRNRRLLLSVAGGLLVLLGLARAQGWIDGNGFPIPADYGTLNAAVTLAAGGNTQIIAPQAGSVIRVAHLSLSTTAAEDIQLFRSTGAACAGAVAISGVYKSVQSLALDFPAGSLRLPVGNGLCVNQSAAQALGGLVVYGQHP